MQLGPFHLKNPWILAPMAGVSEVPFRRIARALGAGATPTELVSARGLLRGQARSRHYLDHDADEKPFWVQIFGGDPVEMGEAAACARELGAELVDINMGCPVKKVTKTGAGSSLCRDLPRAAAIVAEAVKQAGVPITAKIRTGWDADSINAVEACQRLADAGAAAITIHGRTRAQVYSGKADWSVIAEAARSVSIPVIGNGDIATPEDAHRRLTESGCQAVMIGRGAMGNPWIFSFLAELRTEPVSAEERWAMVQRHFFAHLDFVGREHELSAIRRFRPHLVWYSRGLRGAGAFRARAMHIDTLAELIPFCEAFYLGAAAGDTDDLNAADFDVEGPG